jgi:hypothetical protein
MQEDKYQMDGEWLDKTMPLKWRLRRNSNLASTELCAYHPCVTLYPLNFSLIEPFCVINLQQSLRSPRCGSKNSVYIFRFSLKAHYFSRKNLQNHRRNSKYHPAAKPHDVCICLYARGTLSLSSKIVGHRHIERSLFLTFGLNLVIETVDRSWSSRNFWKSFKVCKSNRNRPTSSNIQVLARGWFQYPTGRM